MKVKGALENTVMLTVFECKYRREEGPVFYCALIVATLTANNVTCNLMIFSCATDM